MQSRGVLRASYGLVGILGYQAWLVRVMHDSDHSFTQTLRNSQQFSKGSKQTWRNNSS